LNNTRERREKVLKRILSVLTAVALASAATIVTASAQVMGEQSIKAAGASLMKPGAGAGAGLKAEMFKLVAEARAKGAGKSPPPWQQPVQNNGFSRGRKVAIGVGAAAAVILVIILSRRGGSDRFIAPPCPPGQLCQ
jgi:hypothetical protein